MSSHLRKRFGQHFLKDSFILQKIISSINPQKRDKILEIGPGQGALTELLINACDKLILVEIDRDLVTLLQNKYSLLENIKIYQLDALQLDLEILNTKKNSLRIIGNLPYNISTPLLFHLFSQIEFISDMHFMLQKEVVLRLTAPVRSSNYSRLSVMAQLFCDNTLLFNVPSKTFTPPPKVESAFVRLIPKRTVIKSLNNLDKFSIIVKEAFSYRRKKIANALKKLIPNEQWGIIGINPEARPQELTVDDFIKISNSLKQL